MEPGLPGSRHHRQGAAVKRTDGGNNLISPFQMEFSVAAGKLYRRLVSLRPAIAKEDPVQTAILDEKLGQLDLRNGIELV